MNAEKLNNPSVNDSIMRTHVPVTSDAGVAPTAQQSHDLESDLDCIESLDETLVEYLSSSSSSNSGCYGIPRRRTSHRCHDDSGLRQSKSTGALQSLSGVNRARRLRKWYEEDEEDFALAEESGGSQSSDEEGGGTRDADHWLAEYE